MLDDENKCDAITDKALLNRTLHEKTPCMFTLKMFAESGGSVPQGADHKHHHASTVSSLRKSRRT